MTQTNPSYYDLNLNIMQNTYVYDVFSLNIQKHRVMGVCICERGVVGWTGLWGEKKNAMRGGKSMGKGTGKGKTKFGRADKKPTRQNTHTYSAKQT